MTKVNTSNLYRKCRALLSKVESRGATNGEAAAAINAATGIVAKYGLDRSRLEWPPVPTGYVIDESGHVAKAPEPAPAKKTKRTRKPRKATGPRAGTKQSKLIEMLRRPGGATAEQLLAALPDWQPHTLRGAISGALRKKLGLMVESKREGGVTTYWIEA